MALAGSMHLSHELGIQNWHGYSNQPKVHYLYPLIIILVQLYFLGLDVIFNFCSSPDYDGKRPITSAQNHSLISCFGMFSLCILNCWYMYKFYTIPNIVLEIPYHHVFSTLYIYMCVCVCVCVYSTSRCFVRFRFPVYCYFLEISELDKV